jgi:GNAT superfamily N-acetyltransferase
MILRSAKPEDAMAVARVHVRSWQAAYRDLISSEYLDQLFAEDRAPRYDFGTSDPGKPATIVAASGDDIYGFATVSPADGQNTQEVGELCALYVDPEWWGRGIGVALVAEARGRLSRRGLREAILWVLAGNERADRFYQHDGWVPDGGQRTEALWGVTVEEIRYRCALKIG